MLMHEKPCLIPILRVHIYELLSKTILVVVIAPEVFYDKSWTGPMLFSMNCSTLYNQVLAFSTSLDYAYHTLCAKRRLFFL